MRQIEMYSQRRIGERRLALRIERKRDAGWRSVDVVAEQHTQYSAPAT